MKFNEIFDLNKEAMLPNAERVRKRVLNRRQRLINTVIACASACAVFAVALVIVFLMMGREVAEPEKIVTGTVNIIESVSASAQSEIGMKIDSSLKITTTEDVSETELKARLSVTPESDYSIRKTSSCNYELKFSDKLEENTLYNLQAIYNGKTVYRWAFQTETAFSITNVSPENETHVAADTAIEVTFSHADVTGFEEAFEISPALNGTFEHYGRTWAFIPGSPMEPATLYTVTIKKEVTGPDGLRLEDDHVFSFTISPEGSYAYLIYQQNEAADTFLVNEAPIAAICYENIDVSAATVHVYRFDDSTAYIDAYKKYVRNGEVSAEIMALAGETYQKFNTTPALTTDYNAVYSYAAFINYPEPLPLGYYFAEIQLGGRKMYQLLESTTLSVYTITSNGDYTVWVNDTETGEAVSGASVSLEGFKDGKTSAHGIVTFENAEKSLEGRVLTVENGDYPYVAVLNGGSVDSDLALHNNYYSYISTSSKLYKPGDTVKAFGVILPRKSGVKIPSQITLQCDFIDEEYTVEVSGNGSFRLDIPLNNTAVSYGSIYLKLKETELTSAYFSVADYELPTYQVTVTTDKLAYKAGEPVSATAQVTYMDGTPAAGVLVSSDNGTVKGYTDENGSLSGAVIAELYNSEYYADANHPEVHSLSFSIEDGTDAYYGDSAEFMVFGSNYFLDGDYADSVLTVKANWIDMSKTEQADVDKIFQEAYEKDRYAGAVASVDLVGELHELTYEKVPNGTTYDAINKRVVYSWIYEQKDEVVRTFDLAVTEGTGRVEIPEKPDENCSYYVVLRPSNAEDAAVIKVYLTDYNYIGGGEQTYNMVADKSLADIGESVELLVRSGSNNEAINSGSVLYTVVSGEIVETFHSVLARTSLKFKKEYAPDIIIYGAYFDGKHVYSLGNELVDYDLENSRLQIEMEKDQQQYQPGDKVTLDFTVTDQDGAPVSAVLNISVLDRALYLISGEFDDPLYQLYGSRCYGSEVYTTCSHREFMRGEPLYGEGGGGGDAWRDDFEDMPFFDMIRTDSHGKATVTFALPDSITEWKVIARAFTEEVEAGMESFALRSTQDFFTQVSMSDDLKVTDDFTVAVKGEGLKASAGAVCKFTVGLTDRDGNEIKTLTAEAEKSKYAYLNFGSLDAGVYTVYIQTECGDLKDSLIKTFSVVESQATVWIHNQQPIEDSLSLSIAPKRGNVTLTVVDEQQAFWQKAMARLRSSAGDRVDQVLGQYLSDQFYSTGVWNDTEKLDHSVIRSYMDYDGVRLMPDSDASDLRVTAKLAAVAAEFCDKESLRWSFEQYMNNRYAARIDVISAYFGLAALGEPVLADLQVLYATQSDLTAEEAAYLALAFAYSGDYTTARYIFDAQLKPLLVIDGEKTYFAIEGDVDEDITGCCTLLSNRLSLEYSEGLINFILETDTEYTLLNLELISYLNDHVSETTGTNTVTVSTGDGRNESYAYQKMGALVLTLSPEQASSVRIMSVEGNSVASYAYHGSVDELQQLGSKISMGAEIPTSVQLGKTSVITLHVDIPADFELPSLDLTLPAGLRFESGTVQTKDYEYSVWNEYNSDVIHAPLMYGSNTVILEVRGAMPGSYELEPITITNSADNRFMTTDSVQITVAE